MPVGGRLALEGARSTMLLATEVLATPLDRLDGWEGEWVSEATLEGVETVPGAEADA